MCYVKRPDLVFLGVRTESDLIEPDRASTVDLRWWPKRSSEEVQPRCSWIFKGHWKLPKLGQVKIEERTESDRVIRLSATFSYSYNTSS